MTKLVIYFCKLCIQNSSCIIRETCALPRVFARLNVTYDRQNFMLIHLSYQFVIHFVSVNIITLTKGPNYNISLTSFIKLMYDHISCRKKLLVSFNKVHY